MRTRDDAYGRACAISQEHSLPALEAVHIKAYSEGGEHAVSNGILFRSDIHSLFDKGYVTVTPGHRFLVSRRLKDDFSNGRSYYGFNQEEIRLPSFRQEGPDPKILEWMRLGRGRLTYRGLVRQRAPTLIATRTIPRSP
jgi:putative restriction endonuclease